MPKPNGNTWRRCRAKMDITSDQAAQILGITGGALRQIETNVKPVSLALAFRAERLYRCPVDELLAEEQKPDKPKKAGKVEPKVEPTAPPARKPGRTGPPRVDMRAAS